MHYCLNRILRNLKNLKSKKTQREARIILNPAIIFSTLILLTRRKKRSFDPRNVRKRPHNTHVHSYRYIFKTPKGNFPREEQFWKFLEETRRYRGCTRDYHTPSRPGKFYFAEANSKAKMTKSRRKIAKLLLASATPTRRPTWRYIRYIRYIRYVGRPRRRLVGLEEEEEEGEKRSRRLSRFRDAFVGTSTPRTSARSLGLGYILVAGKSPIEFPVDLATRNGVESKRKKEKA